MSPLGLLVVVALAWLVWAGCALVVMRNPKGDVPGGMALLILPAFTRVYHRLRAVGVEHIPSRADLARQGRPLIVVANHTAGVDPMLVQALCARVGSKNGLFLRWVMASEMRAAALEFLWAWAEIIFVSTSRDARADELRSVKEMIRHLRAGGTLGIFPEGGIAEPRGVLLPFRPGLGTLVAKTDALVLPMIIEGTIEGRTAWHSLLIPGRARVRVMPVIDYQGTSAGAIVADLQARYTEWTGWPVKTDSAIAG